MTYSEVREMYSMDALDYFEKKERNRRRVYSSISFFFSWLIPWTISVALLTLGMDLLNAKGVTLSLIFLFLSLFLFKAITKEERNLRILFIFSSYLVTLSFLLTVVLY